MVLKDHNTSTGLLDPIHLVPYSQKVSINNTNGIYTFESDFQKTEIGFIKTHFSYNNYEMIMRSESTNTD